MAKSENPLLNEFCAAAAQSRRLRIRFKGPAPCPVPDANAGQCLKQSVNACKSFNRNRIADNGKKLHFSNLNKGIPKIRTLITKRAVEFRPMVSSSPNLRTWALNRFMCFHRLMEKPVVVATYNDLVLCCMTEDYQRIYYICNAYTMQYVVLPPTPSRCHKSVRVGFICNVPDYKCEEDDWKGNNFQRNVECRYTVVRILPPVNFENGEKKCDTFKLNLEIFSSDTGEWRESVVSSPRHFNFGRLKELSFTYNGMLYWLPDRDFIVIGLGPFYNNDGTSSSNNNGDGIIDHKLGFTIFEETLDFGFMLQYSGVCRGYVLLCNMSMLSRSLYVYELKQSQDDGAAAGKKLYLSKRRVYSFDAEMIPFKSNILPIAFDPSNKDIFYLHVDDDIIKWNVHTGKWSKIFKHWAKRWGYYTVVLPWWPTSIPRLPQQQQQ
ncbi:unnamed protein product [Prunus brigantina]